MQHEQFIDVSLDGHVGTITMQRPPHNYINPAFLADIADALESLDREPACRAVVLRSEGKSFCAGADLSGRAQRDANGAAPAAVDTNPLYSQAARVFSTGKPIVVAVQGAAIGAGLGLAVAGDFRVCSTEARFAANFVKLGYHPGFALTLTLPRLIGQQKAALMFLTGRRINAGEAADYGLADMVTEPESLWQTAADLAAEIAENAPLGLAATRATLRAGLAEAVRAQTDIEWAQQKVLGRTEDFAEGVRSVAERRPGNFVGR